MGKPRKSPLIWKEGVRTRAVVRGTVEGKGGGEQRQKIPRFQELQGWGPRYFGGAQSSTGTPPLNFQVLPAAQVGRRETSGSRASVWAELGVSNQ